MNPFKKCKTCKEIEKMIEAGGPNDLKLQEMLDRKELILFAANCEPKDFYYWMDRGNHYTMNAYFECPYCHEFYYAGHCLYGRPVIKKVTKDDSINQATRLEWGYLGSYFSH